MRPVYPIQTTTTPTTTTTQKSSFFGGIRNYFRKTPTTVSPVIVPPTPQPIPKVTPNQPGQVNPLPNQNIRNYVAPTKTTLNPLPTTKAPQKDNFPVLPPVPNTPKPNQNIRDYVAPATSTTTKPKENFPSLPAQTNPKPNHNIRDYVAPAPTKKTQIEDFPALPPSRVGTPIQQPTPTIPSVWGSTKSSNGVTPSVQFIPSKPANVVPKTPIPHHLPASGSNSEDTEFTELTELLLTKDINNAYKYIKVNYQGKTQSFSSSDEASEK